MSDEETTMELTETSIEAWLLANPVRAYAFGERLIKFMADEDGLLAQPSLGTMEDRLTAWATEHKIKARLLFMRLMGKIVEAKKAIEKEAGEE